MSSPANYTGNLRKVLSTWKFYIKNKSDAEQRHLEDDLTTSVVHVLRHSRRCKRTEGEKDLIRKFLIKYAKCVPCKQMQVQEIDQLCNEVDILSCIGNAIVFLQGDFGNKYYIIARGKVALYQQMSKDAEVANAREYADYRGKPFPGRLIIKFILHL